MCFAVIAAEKPTVSLTVFVDIQEIRSKTR
jgi:hypothetical protein